MKTLLCMSLALLLAAAPALAGEDEAAENLSVWLGSQYTDFQDSPKKIGEYDKSGDGWGPEVGLNYFSRSDNTTFRLDGHYFDEENIIGQARGTVGNTLRFNARYRSLTHQTAQDRLANLEAREYLASTGNPGGKMLTHEIVDPDADYNIHRREILTRFQALLSQKNNVRLSLNHRSIIEDGTEQAIASNHCFSCHVTSRTRTIDQAQHQFEAGLDAEFGRLDLGYRFQYRLFDSDAPDVSAYYDPAKNPVSGAAAGEFSSRLVYDDEELVFGRLPRTEKTSHRVRLKTDLGKGRMTGSLGYARAKNKKSGETTESLIGAANYAVRLNDKTRLVTKGTAARQIGGDPYIDLPTFRDGAADLNETDFDYTRISTLDRWDTRLSAQVISRLTNRLTLSVLAGYNRIDRDDYPLVNEGTSTEKLTGQARLRYRKGLRLSTAVKYRFEKVSNPFVSARGLFEAAGNDILEPLIPVSQWIFYFQREDLRYQDITSLPTDKHVVEWKLSDRPNDRFSFSLGAKFTYDKNGDLDSLDVKHHSLQPSVALNFIPNAKWTLAAGYTGTLDKSRLPVTVALFDG
ncbi:MAG: hypothetical protein JSW34_00355 [Candidatus Zixiibacteriota bacterium]|nr:MAG: hypothetical protein JSW34_00355 [candidate division Zixibacteria bacterium]